MIFVQAESKKEATSQKGFDWAKIVKVDGGYAFFESITEFKIWKNQK